MQEANGTNKNEPSGPNAAEWRYTPDQTLEARGPGILTLWYRCETGTTTLRTYVGTFDPTKNTYPTAWVDEGVTDTELPCDGTVRQANISVDTGSFNLYEKKNKQPPVIFGLNIKVMVEAGSDVFLQYDAPGTPSAFFISTQPVTP